MKKAAWILTLFIAAAVLFAQNAPSTGLSDKDVKNFAKNYRKIERMLDKYDVEDFDDDDFLTSIRDYDAVEAALEKYGVSGPNAVEKVSMIGTCMSYISLEKRFERISRNAQMSRDFEKFSNVFSGLKTYVNEDDCAVVRNNFATLSKVVDD